MAEKRYFWLRLQHDFFQSKRIKKLRKLAGGDTYTIIYLKMQLKAIMNDGVLTYTGIEPTFAEELALDIDEEPDNVLVTVNYLLSCGLMETADNKDFVLPYAIENTGAADSSAERVRRFRERQKQLAIANGDSSKNIPQIDKYTNEKRYGGHYFDVCKRDNFCCAICGSIENLCVHHIDGYSEDKPENNEKEKLILLCRSCHSLVHASSVSIPDSVLVKIGYKTRVTPCNVTRNATGNGESEKEKEKELYIQSDNRLYVSPSLPEIESFARDRNSPVDPKRFFTHYEGTNWTDKKGKQIRDWKKQFVAWEAYERKQKPTDRKFPDFDDGKADEQLDRLLRKMNEANH